MRASAEWRPGSRGVRSDMSRRPVLLRAGVWGHAGWPFPCLGRRTSLPRPPRAAQGLGLAQSRFQPQHLNPTLGAGAAWTPRLRGCPGWALPGCSPQAAGWQLESFELPLEALPAPKSWGFGEPEPLGAPG